MLSNRLTRRVLGLVTIALLIALGQACNDAVVAPGSDADSVTDLKVEPLGATRMQLRWTNIASAGGYVIERRAGLSGQFSKLADVPAPSGTTVTYIDDDVEPETFYGYRVGTRGRLGGMSGASEVVGAKSAPAPGIDVTVNMTAPVPAGADPNGFQLTVAGPDNVTAHINANTNALVTPLTPGTYTVTLGDVANTCAVVGGASKTVNLTGQGTQTIVAITFSVVCRDPSKGGIVVAVTASGDTTDGNGVDVRVQGTAGGGSSITEHLATPIGTTYTQDLSLLSLTSGSYEVSLLDVNTSICSLNGFANRSVSVASARIDTVRFNMNCTSNLPPHAEAGGPYSGIANAPINFSSAGSSDPDGTIATYAWDFGDAGTATVANPSHAYAAAGSYKAKLTVTDNRGRTNTDSATVTVVAGFAWKSTFSADSVQASEKVRLEVSTQPGPGVTDVSAVVNYNSAVIRLDSIKRDPRWDLDFSTDGTLPGTAALQAVRGSPGDSTAPARVATLYFTGVGAVGAVATTSTQGINLKRSDGSTIPTSGLFVIEDTVRIRSGGNRPPTAKVNGPTVGEARKPLTFTAQPGTADPDGTLASLQWTFGDGTSAANASIVQKTWTKPGTFTVKLTVIDNAGATASDSVRVAITEPPNVSPIAEAGGPYTGVDGVPVAFSAVGSIDPDGQIIRYDWQFGDGTAGIGATTFRTYATPGTYIAVLTVIDDRGGFASDTARVTITQNPQTNRPPVAKANGPYNGTAGVPVPLSAIGSFDPDGTIASYTWYHEDQTTSTGPSPLKTFATAGIYKIILEVKDNLGAVGVDTATAIIGGAGQTNLAPVAEANGPYTTRTNVPVAFQSIGSVDFDGFIASYQWTFGDGTTGTGASPTHVYTQAGVYAVTLLVTDNKGASAVDNTAVTVLQGIAPVAKITGPAIGTTGNPVFFHGALSVDADGSIVSYVWDFGDNSVGVGISVGHAWSTAGTYKVRLTVTDNHGLTGQDSVNVTVTGPKVNLAPIAKANGPYSGSINLPIGFSAAGSTDPDGTIVSYSWTFGDGGTGTGLSTFHLYAAVGSYKAVLTVVDDKGAVDVDTAQVTVSNGPTNNAPRAEANGPYSGAVNTAISFTSAGSVDTDGTIVSYAWLFGDGGSAVGPTPTHTYSVAGTYKVYLTVLDNQGATGTDSAQVIVTGGGGGTNQKPVAEANGPYSAAQNVAISFSSAGSQDPDGTITSYAWNFGDGGTATTANPTHAYTTAGTFTVILTVTDNLGATDADTAQAIVSEGGGTNQKPVAEANGPYTGTVNSAISFSAAGSSDPDGSIASYAWTFGDGGTGTGASPTHAYTTAGSYMAIVTVTDNLGAVDADTATVTVTGGAAACPTTPTTICGRWVNASGAPITSATSGQTIYLELDVRLVGQNIDAFQGRLNWTAARLALTDPQNAATDLNCSATGGQATCPSGTPPTGNVDRLNQFTAQVNPPAGQLGLQNFSQAGNGTGIQGIAKVQFTVGSGTGSEQIVLTILIATGDGGNTNLEPGLKTHITIPPLTVN
jgi:PKD repeat protein